MNRNLLINGLVTVVWFGGIGIYYNKKIVKTIYKFCKICYIKLKFKTVYSKRSKNNFVKYLISKKIPKNKK